MDLSTLKPEAITALVAVGSYVSGIFTTWMVTRAERRKVLLQLDREALHRRQELVWLDLRRLFSDLLTATDPEIQILPDYRKVVRLINQIQLFLDVEKEEGRLVNDAVNKLGYAVADYYRLPVEIGPERDDGAQKIFAAHAKVAESARVLFNRALR